jgi:hypothetical protein
MIYYVSTNANGNGTSENSPLSLTDLKNITLRDDDVVLFKRGDVFYETVEYTKTKDAKILFDAYGTDIEPPTFSYCRIVNNSNYWTLDSENIYKIDLKDNTKHTGTKNTTDANNVAFIVDNSNKNTLYCNRKETKLELENNFDFYCDDDFVYVYCNTNPNYIIENICFVCASNSSLFKLESNTILQNIRFEYLGGHAVVGYNSPENVVIQNNEFNFIGGGILTNHSYYRRYGNAIEFLSYAKNLIVRNNKISNCYDAGFTVQGIDGYWENVSVCNNIFKNNSQSFEVWSKKGSSSNGDNLGFKNVKFYNNLCIGQGRGWGNVRPDKDKVADIEIQNLELKYNDISIKNNIFYNPIRLVYVNTSSKDTYKTNINQNNNKIYLSSDSKILNYDFDLNTVNDFINQNHKENDSKFMESNSLNVYDNIYEKISVLIDELNINRNNKIFNSSINSNDTIIYDSLDSTSNNDYILISEFNLVENYERKELILFYSLIDDSVNFEDMGLIKVRVSTDDKKIPSIYFSSQNGNSNIYIDNRNFELYYKMGAQGITNIKIYYKIAKAYSKLLIKKVFARGIEINYGKLETPVTGYTKLTSSDISKNTFETIGNETNLGYIKVCQIITTKKYDYATCKISAIDITRPEICQCDLYIKVRQELDVNNNPQVVLVCKNDIEDNTQENTVLTYKNFFAKIKNIEGKNIVEVYYKFNKNYCRIQFDEKQRFVIGDSKVSLNADSFSILNEVTGDKINCS